MGIKARDEMRFDRITVNPNQMDGVPCLRGLRIPVATVVDMVADAMKYCRPTPTCRRRTSQRPFDMLPKLSESVKSLWRR